MFQKLFVGFELLSILYEWRVGSRDREYARSWRYGETEKRFLFLLGFRDYAICSAEKKARRSQGELDVSGGKGWGTRRLWASLSNPRSRKRFAT